MWGLATLPIGGLFGWMTPGLRNRTRVLRVGLGLGIVVGVVLAVFGRAIGSRPLGIGDTGTDAVAAGIGMAVLFVVGVWIGDVLRRYSVATEEP